MSAAPTPFDDRRPIDLGGDEFCQNKYEWYRWMLEAAPVCEGRVSILRMHLVSRFDDCRTVLTDERFIRNRGRAKGRGSSPFPIPVPRAVAALTQSMILEDDPAHRRLRNLVNKAFTAHAVGRLSESVEARSHEFLDGLEAGRPFDLIERYSRPLPTRVIAEMVGVPREIENEFEKGLSVLTKGMTGMGLVRTLLWDLRRTARFVRNLIDRKRDTPGDDILTALIEAEEGGDRLSTDELVAMVFLLMVGGFETTMHLIANGVRTLLEHPDSLERLHAEPESWASATQEIVRHRGPIHGTKLMYPTEDLEVHGVTIRKGQAVMPMLAAANHDPRVFDAPDEFDIVRSPNNHLGFGFGMHFCLGRQLALMETEIALRNLFERHPDLRLAVDASELELARMPGWHRHLTLPVVFES